MATDRPPGTRRSGPGDRELAEQVRARLVQDERLDARQIAVEVAAGVVTLTGEAGTLAAKRAAGDLAYNVAGVADVRNLLTVAGAEPLG